MSAVSTFASLNALATHLRQELENKKFISTHAYNGTGKTRLSTAFKDLGKVGDTDGQRQQRNSTSMPSPKTCSRGTTTWRMTASGELKLNTNSSFFAGLESMEMDNRIRTLLDRYADFEFRIDTTIWEVVFAREFRAKKDGIAGDEVDSAGRGAG